MNTRTPYGFVPVELGRAHVSEPIFRHGANAEQAGLMSGELRVTMTTLTPTIVGNYRYAASASTPPRSSDSEEDATEKDRLNLHTSFGIEHPINKDKPILEPLFAPCSSGKPWEAPVLIPPRSIKGLLRQSIGALLNAPMERVKDRQFAFRPNLDRNFGSTTTRCVPAIVRSVKFDEAAGAMTFLELQLIKSFKGLLWVKNDGDPAEKHKVLSDAFGQCVAGATCPAGSEIADTEESEKERPKRKYLVQRKGRSVRLAEDSELCSYHPGADGVGMLAAAHEKGTTGGAKAKYRWMIVPISQMANRVTLRAPSALLANLARTYRFLSSTLSNQLGDGGEDEIEGHLDDHPKLSEVSAVRNRIRERSRWDVGQLVFVEVRTDEANRLPSTEERIISLGHHFRYWWAYSDSVKSVAVSNSSTGDRTPRATTAPLACERETHADFDDKVDAPPSVLSGARSFFGYAQDRKNRGTDIGRGDFGRLAGRLSPNFAVEVVDSSDPSVRFLDELRGRVLPILGTPKPSATECYIRESNFSERNNVVPPELFTTYGEPGLPTRSGELAGRKFYRHAGTVPDTFAERYVKCHGVLEALRRAAAALSQSTRLSRNRSRELQLCDDVGRIDALPVDPREGARLFERMRPEQLDQLSTLVHCKETAADLQGIRNEIVACRDDPNVFPLLTLAAALASQQSTIVRFVSNAGRQFRFTLRFRDLRPSELALIVAVLEPGRFATAIDATDSREFAHKIGYARPLGYGSVRFAVERCFTVFRGAADGRIAPTQESLDSFMDQHISPALATVLGESGENQTLHRWLALLHFDENQVLAYPTEIDDRGKRSIYLWHTKARRNHSRNRSSS